MPKSVKINQFVQQRLRLNAIAANPSYRWINPAESRAIGAGSLRSIEDQIRDRREHLAEAARPSTLFTDLRAAIIARQSIGDPPPKAANDNQAQPSQPRVRPAKAKSIRGALADSLPMLLKLRNTPDHVPEPVTSNWATDPSAVIPEIAQDDRSGSKIANASEEMARDIRPSIAFIMDQVAKNAPVHGQPRPPVGKRRRQPAFGPIVAIGKLKFSNGKSAHRVTERTEAGIVTTLKPAPAGVMLGTVERLARRHGGDGSGVPHLSNSRTVALFFGKDEDGRPNNWRPFIPANPKRRKGRNLTTAQSRELIAAAIANTPVMPPVTRCPPGVASGTARFSDQFIGLVSGSTGKGGAPNWVDHFTALRDHEVWVDALDALDGKSSLALRSALSASSRTDVGVAVGQSQEYARRQGGTRALIAANDNFAKIIKQKAA